MNDRIAALADGLFVDRKPLYRFTHDRSGVILHHEWIEYLGRNTAILRVWIRFRLAEYLQSKNPSVAGIVEKLEPPLARAPLTGQTAWWREALPRIGDRARRICTGSSLDPADMPLDHCLPWSFVAHDRLWSLVPVSRSANSSKSDRIPDRRCRQALVGIQHAAITALNECWAERRWTDAVEPWILDLGIGKESLIDREKLRRAYEDTMAPLEVVAERQGFRRGWEYGANHSEGRA